MNPQTTGITLTQIISLVIGTNLFFVIVYAVVFVFTLGEYKTRIVNLEAGNKLMADNVNHLQTQVYDMGQRFAALTGVAGDIDFRKGKF